MKVNKIYFNKQFKNQFFALPKKIQGKACKAEKLFRKNPFHPSLRLHKLKGKLEGMWSISLDMKYRIVFEPLENGEIIFFSIGLHAIYE